jgi:outer membrane protein assembly factor BamD (BamD/ComL family)
MYGLNSRNRWMRLLFVALVVVATASCCLPVQAARESKGNRATDLAARRLLKRALELLEATEYDRGVKMLQTIILQHPMSQTRYEAHIALARHFNDQQDFDKAIESAKHLLRLKKQDEEIEGDDKELYLEGLYLTGVCHFHKRDYSGAFSILRQITSRYPNTIWANQAYFYIGMSHFAQSHWNKAIKALSLVGTFIDPASPEIELAEAGRRIYVKIEDADLPILKRQGKDITVALRTEAGDTETTVCVPLTGKAEIYIGSVATDLNSPAPNDGTLQIIGGDMVYARYLDDNTKAGDKDVPREKMIRIVSSAALTFTLATFESKTLGAFINQPVFLKLRDADLDVSDNRDNARIRLVSRFKSQKLEKEGTEEESTIDVTDILKADRKPTFEIRDELLVDLVETAGHSGEFTGELLVNAGLKGSNADRADGRLVAVLSDEIMASYTDEKHIAGGDANEITAKVRVYGEINDLPTIDQNVVQDSFVKAKKDMVEAEAYLELARIFNSMGLRDGASAKAESGLERTDFTLTTVDLEGSPMRQEAFRLKWELYLAQDDLAKAMATCKIFHKLYPDSPLVDRALMGIAKVLAARGEIEEAIAVYSQVLHLENAFSQPEAQFRIAEILESQAIELAEETDEPVSKETAIRAYKECAKRYPDSPFAGRSMGKVIDYHIQGKEYVVADDLLGQVFLDYQDETFLDSMLLKWVIVAYRMGNLEKALEKCQELVFEYPGSEYAPKAQVILDKIRKKLGRDKEKTIDGPTSASSATS